MNHSSQNVDVGAFPFPEDDVVAEEAVVSTMLTIKDSAIHGNHVNCQFESNFINNESTSDFDFELERIIEDDQEAPKLDSSIQVVGDHGVTQASGSNIIESPNGSRYWIPNCPNELKPVVGAVFSSFEEAKLLYDRYAQHAGFSTRLATTKRHRKTGQISLRYILCNKAGKPKNTKTATQHGNANEISKRLTRFKVTDCSACIKLVAIPGTTGCKLYNFVEAHNHSLLGDVNRDFSKACRKLQYAEKRYILSLSTINIGPSLAYRMRTMSSGGRTRVHGNVVDFRNFRRDMNQFIGARDAQLLVDRMAMRKKNEPKLTFVYERDDDELVLLFWADETAKTNYQAFGDVMAFDATYRTNKYKMVFVPFTGVDHHTKTVTFGGALIKKETIESYTWVLEEFLKAHSSQPKLVLTDQDPAMKVAVASTFSQSSHRLCMWHVMDKLPIKIAGDLLANTDLRKRINKLVWNTYLTPTEFEESWNKLIDEFSLNENKWLNDMYLIRNRWIPAYFRNLPMCCLMKTTSRAESANALFRRYMNADNTLLEFMICFETAMEDQRFNQRSLDNDTNTSTPIFMTHLPIERFAASVYTHEIFAEVQKEIWKGVWSCAQKNFATEGGCDQYVISHKDKRSNVIADFKVVINKDEKKLECSCLNFDRIGYLCRHIFCVFKFLGVDVIPDRYVLHRWRKDALPDDVFKKQQRCRTENDVRDDQFYEAVSIVESCAARLRGDSGKLTLFVEKLKQMEQDIFTDIPHEPEVNSNEAVFKSFLNVSSPEKVTIKTPAGARNKGCGTNKRMIGPGEKAVAKLKKNPRLCKTCKKYVFHDSRTCDLNPKNKKRLLESKTKGQCSTSKQARNTS